MENEIDQKLLEYIGGFTIMEKGFIITVFGKNDCRIGLFQPETNLLSKTEKTSHNKWIQDCLKINEDTFITGSRDNKMKVWKYIQSH